MLNVCCSLLLCLAERQLQEEEEEAEQQAMAKRNLCTSNQTAAAGDVPGVSQGPQPSPAFPHVSPQ